MNYKIKDLEVVITDEQLDELIKERENKGKPWKPEVGEEYWYVDEYGDEVCIYWSDDRFDLRRYNTGNCFKTEEEARQKAEYDDAVIAVNEKIRELNDGWTPDWGDRNQKKHVIYCNNHNNKWVPDWGSQINYLTIFECMKSREVAEQVIEECAKELEIIKNYNLK